MSASMAEVLAGHKYKVAEGVCSCSDDVQVGLKCDPQTHEEHVAEQLAANGYGKLEDAWDEGFFDGKRQDNEGDDGPRFVNPYRRPE